MATGTRTFGQFNLESVNSDRPDTDFANTLENRHKTRWPLTAWLSKKGNSKQKKTTKFVLFEEDLIPRTGTATKTIATTGSTTGVGAASLNGIVANTLLHFPAAWAASTSDDPGELVLVTAVTTSMTVRRVTTDAQIADNSGFVIMGNTDTETSTSGPAAFDMEPASVTLYMTILKRRIDISITERNSEVRGAASRLKEKLNRAKMDFMLDIEHNSWFSRSGTDATNLLRYSAGLIPQIAGDTNATKTDAGGAALSKAMISDTIANSAVDATSNNYAVFHGKQFMGGLWELEMGDMQTRVGETTYGMWATSITAPGGFVLDLIYCRVFDIIGTPYNKMAVGLDMGSVQPVHLKEGRPKFTRNVHTDDSGEKESHQWRYQGGISSVWPRRHWIIYDVSNI